MSVRRDTRGNAGGQLLKTFLVLFLGLLVALLIWGFVVEPYILVDRTAYDVPIRNLSESWEGQRIAVIGDYQIGMWLDNEGTIERIVDLLVEERPAAVLIVGDFVYHPIQNSEREAQRAAELTRPLIEAGIPVYGVLGNHDYAMKGPDATAHPEIAERVFTTMEAIGVDMLANDAAALDLTGAPEATPLYIVGLGAHYPNEARPELALSRVPDDAPRIVMMHNPDTFERLPPNTAPLAVAGHTHGGQVSIPFTPEWTWMTFVREDAIHAAGWIDGYGAPGNRLYINRGIGFSILPMRINAPPEVTIFTLRAS